MSFHDLFRKAQQDTAAEPPIDGTSYTLDAVGNRMSKIGRRIEKVSPTATSIFAYDGPNLVETVNATGGIVARYTQGQNIDEPLAESRSGTVSYYEQDGIGSVTSLTNSSGTVAQTYTYDSFGNTTNSTGSLTNFFRYTGREFDSETGIYYYRARYYDAMVGRFVSEDPIQFRGGPDFYVWPRGRCSCRRRCQRTSDQRDLPNVQNNLRYGRQLNPS